MYNTNMSFNSYNNVLESNNTKSRELLTTEIQRNKIDKNIINQYFANNDNSSKKGNSTNNYINLISFINSKINKLICDCIKFREREPFERLK